MMVLVGPPVGYKDGFASSGAYPGEFVPARRWRRVRPLLKSMATKSNLVIAIMTLTFAVTILIAAGLLYSSKSRMANGPVVTGKVVSLTAQESARPGAQAPLVEFKTEKGDTVQVQSTRFTEPPAYAVGQAVEVRYDPQNPQNAAINVFAELWGLTAALGAFGGFALLVGAGLLLFLK
jgi:hypothetical protein